MKFERDDQDRQWTEDDAGQWTKEQARRDQRFDFAAFLGPDSLEDRVTDALDGKDLLDKEAYGSFAPDYVPRRPSERERGRHEAPGPEPEEDEERDYDDGLNTNRFGQDDDGAPQWDPSLPPEFRQEPTPRVNVNDPPPRPKVVVAGPAPRVVVIPDRQYDDVPHSGGGGGGGGKGMKWLIALLISIGVIALAGVALFTLAPGLLGGASDPLASPSATPGGLLDGLLRPDGTQAPVVTSTPTPAVTPPPVVHHTISVTAGSGGTISPGGAVDVQDGASVTFTITPDEGYEMGQLLIDGAPVSVQSSYTFSNVDRDHTIYAVFQPAQTPPPPETEAPSDEPQTELTPEPQTEVTPEPQTETGPGPMVPPQGEGT